MELSNFAKALRPSLHRYCSWFVVLAFFSGCNFRSKFAESAEPIATSTDDPESGDTDLPVDTGSSASAESSSAATTSSSSSSSSSAPSAAQGVTADFGFGQVYYDLTGTKALILCFHGRGGQADGWQTHNDKYNFLMDLKAKGYSFICPSSVDRTTGSWDPSIKASNVDIVNIDKILNYLKIPAGEKIYLVGHSQGTSMVSRYPTFGARRTHVSAVQFSNAVGSARALDEGNYKTPSIFNYSNCDPIVDPATVLGGIDVLKKNNATIEVNELSAIYTQKIAAGDVNNCHDFLNLSEDTAKFFARF